MPKRTYPTRLAGWLEKHEVTAAELARDIDATRQQVVRFANGERIPDVMNAVGIEEHTQGAVACSYWAELQRKRRRRNGPRPS